jgi:hypothetical protein
LNKPCVSEEEYRARVSEIWKELMEGPWAGDLMVIFEDEEFEGIPH